MRIVDAATLALVLVGAVNWGLVGLARFDLVATVFGRTFGEVTPVSGVVYTLVGLSGVYQAVFFKAIQRRWTAVMLASR